MWSAFSSPPPTPCESQSRLPPRKAGALDLPSSATSKGQSGCIAVLKGTALARARVQRAEFLAWGKSKHERGEKFVLLFRSNAGGNDQLHPRALQPLMSCLPGRHIYPPRLLPLKILKRADAGDFWWPLKWHGLTCGGENLLLQLGKLIFSRTNLHVLTSRES